MRRLRPLSSLLPLLLLLSACTALGIAPADTFNKKELAAINTVDAVVQSTSTLLAAGQITSADAQQVHDQAVNLKAGLEIADQIHSSNPAAGDDKLAATIAGLTALQSYLAGRK